MADGTYIAPAYGWAVYRSLHSRWIDWLMTAPDEAREAVAAHFAWQLDFPHFILAVCRNGWARVSTRISEDGDDAWIGLEVPVTWDDRGTEWQRLFEMHHTVLDLTPTLIVSLGLKAMESELDDVLKATT